MKYVRMTEEEAERFGNWLEAQGFVLDRDSEYTKRKNHYFSAWPPRRLDMRRIVLHKFHNRKVGEWIGLASIDDAWRAYQCFLNGATHVTANIRTPYGPNRAPTMKKCIKLSDYQPQEMRDQYPVPFDIPNDVELSVECRIYFSQHPQEFPEWLSIYRSVHLPKEEQRCYE